MAYISKGIESIIAKEGMYGMAARAETGYFHHSEEGERTSRQ